MDLTLSEIGASLGVAVASRVNGPEVKAIEDAADSDLGPQSIYGSPARRAGRRPASRSGLVP